MSRLPYQLGCSVLTEQRFRGRGQLMARVGERVEPQTILGTESQPAEPLILDLAAALRDTPEAVAGALVVQAGERVARGAVLARSVGPNSGREVVAPEGGVFTSYDENTGLLTLLRMQEQIELRAGVTGTVREAAPGRSVLIETAGALLDGVWGAGGEAHGVVRLGTRSAAEQAALEDLDHRFTYAVLVVGGELTAEVLAHCEALEVGAVVAGGMAAEELGRYLGRGNGELPLPDALERPRPRRRGALRPPVLMLLSGFGATAIPEQAWRVLRECDGREGSLLAPGWPERPRLLVQLPSSLVPERRPPRDAALAEGAVVEVLGGEHSHTVGVVSRYPAHRRNLPSGVPAEAALVRLEGGVQVFVPVANLRVLENGPQAGGIRGDRSA